MYNMHNMYNMQPYMYNICITYVYCIHMYNMQPYRHVYCINMIESTYIWRGPPTITSSPSPQRRPKRDGGEEGGGRNEWEGLGEMLL